MSHSSVSGAVSASKEKRVFSDDGGVAVKLGGQENRAAPAEGETGVCRHFAASPILQGAYRTGPNVLSTPKALPRSLPRSVPRRPFISTDPNPGGLFSTPVALPRYPLSGPTPNTPAFLGACFSQVLFPGMSLLPSRRSRRPFPLPPASLLHPVALKQLTSGRDTRHPGTHRSR